LLDGGGHATSVGYLPGDALRGIEVDVGEHNAGALVCQRLSDGFSKSGSTSGHNCYPAGKGTHSNLLENGMIVGPVTRLGR
jgi:hypothetical protein